MYNYMADLVFRSVCEITHSDWLPEAPIFGLSPHAFYSGLINFGGRIFELVLVKFKEN